MKILVVPDTQVKPGISLDYLSHIGQYIVDKKPDVVVHLGDHWDMPSLSSYDFGKRQYEGRRYVNDIEAGNEGMIKLLSPIANYNARQMSNKKRGYMPRLVFLLGNHEQRIQRAIDSDPKLEGIMGYHDLALQDWEVYKFLEVI